MVSEVLDRCPRCGSETTCQEVDIGVGTMYGLMYCEICGWNQEDNTKEVLKEEH